MEAGSPIGEEDFEGQLLPKADIIVKPLDSVLEINVAATALLVQGKADTTTIQLLPRANS